MVEQCLSLFVNMWRKTILILISTYISFASARPGHSTAGTHFVIPFPSHPYARENSVHCITSEEKVKIDVHHPEIETIDTYILKKNERFSFHLHERQRMDSSGIYKLSFIKSNGPIRVFVNTVDDEKLARAVYRLMPKQSCYLSYYITAPKGFPFINVASFEDKETTVTVTFPETEGKTFTHGCSGNTECKPGAEVTFTLGKYKCWQIALEDDGYDLQNTLVTSDNPVFVIAGSTECRILNGESTDVCISNIQPTESWGKTYIVPNNVQADKIFRFNAVTFPLTVTVHEDRRTRHKINIEMPQNNHSHGVSNKTLAFTADVPFGLYQLFPSMKNTPPHVNNDDDASILNLIPVEQWMHGVHYIYPDISGDVDIVFYITLFGTQKDEFVFGDVENKTVSWFRTSVVNVQYRKYTSSEVDVFGVMASRIYSTNPKARMMVYIRGTDISAGYPRTSFNFPYDFYQGQIYQMNCIKMTIFGPDDGIDNDCDGSIDEEMENGLDDDGDGKVDEDNADRYIDGTWTGWKDVCKATCDKKQQNVRIRVCSNTRGHGKYCDGDDIECDEKSCSQNCTSNDDNNKCFCKACDSCSSYYSCDDCKAGYRLTSHCTSPCPRGWRGVGCTESVAVDVEKFGSSKSQSSLTGIFVFFLFILLLAGAVYMYFQKMKEGNKPLHKKEVRGVDHKEENQMEEVVMDEELPERPGSLITPEADLDLETNLYLAEQNQIGDSFPNPRTSAESEIIEKVEGSGSVVGSKRGTEDESVRLSQNEKDPL